VFVVGGDAPHAVGKFVDAFGLLQALEELGSPFHEVGIAGYPEGHGTIPREAIDMALKQKAPKATRILTQICFEAGTTSRWATGLVASGVNLPIFVGMPGPINRQKLVRISAGIGLGRSARFLRKQQSLLWRFLTPGGYNPTKLATQLAAEAARTVNTIRGLHIFTFNEIRGTERWRRELLASVVENQDRG
jgi:methylenetetrahydrofolate reductase (NADPH)